MKNFILFILVFIALAASVSATNCAVYFSGIGCPHCAKVDPVLLPITTEIYDIVVIDYEVYELQQNAQVMNNYDRLYGIGGTIPVLIYGKDKIVRGDAPILESLRTELDAMANNPCLLPSGNESFDTATISQLAGKPKLWADNRVLISNGGGNDDDVLRGLLTGNITEWLSRANYSSIEPEEVKISGGSVNFEHAARISGWLFEWNGAGVEQKNQSISNNGSQNTTTHAGFTFTRILGLAIVNALNPCALAVLALMLLTIMTANPQNRKKVLAAGFAFIAAVFIIYFFYGIIMTKFFSQIQALPLVRQWLYTILGVIAVLIGLLNIKDFIGYKPGSFGTEMPLFMRPFMKRLITGITSAKGAFIAGAFVTLFLLPCTIGPYLIASGDLSPLGFFKTLPWLALYNAVFILPMVAITFLVYFGLREVRDVSGWRDRNIRKLHLAQGILMVLLGLEMLFSWIEWLIHLFS
jgi:cytochrome c biogenesis protein CcdA